jgi:hypothetical protein
MMMMASISKPEQSAVILAELMVTSRERAAEVTPHDRADPAKPTFSVHAEDKEVF